MYVWRLVRATDEWRLIGTSLIRVVSIEITQVCLLLPDHKSPFLDIVGHACIQYKKVTKQDRHNSYLEIVKGTLNRSHFYW